MCIDARTAATTVVPRTGADLLADALEAAGVEVAFGLPGVHNLAIWKALTPSSVRLVGVRHEQTAVYAADGAARTSGRLGVAITTTGPGAANALGATGEAWASGVPVLVIATDIPTTLRRPGAYRGVLHETRDQAAMFAPVTKATLRAQAADAIGALVRRGAELALRAPSGPVYLEIPTDLLSAPASAPDVSPSPSVAHHAADADAVRRAAQELGRARRPLIWAGGGAVRATAGPAVARLATLLGAPVLETYQARGLLPHDHPCKVTVTPHAPQIGELWDDADVVLAVGTDFDGMMTQNWLLPPPPTLVAVNVEADEASKNYRPDVVLAGDARVCVEQLTGALEQIPVRAQRDLIALRSEVADRERAAHEMARSECPDAGLFLDVMRDVAADAVVVADMCIPGYWLAAYHPFTAPRRLAYPVGWGTLGFGFPASIGAVLAQPQPVVAVCGDGGFLFACGELAVLAQERLPLTVLIVDDGGYGMLRFDQRHAGDAPCGVDLATPDFVALARSFGIEAMSVDGVGPELGDALREATAADGPRVVVARAALQPPLSTSPRWYRRAAD